MKTKEELKEWQEAILNLASERKQEELKFSTIQVIVISIIAMILFFWLPLFLVFADECQDPQKLSPELQQAYYELKEAFKDTDGIKVSIRCTEQRKEEKDEKKFLDKDTSSDARSL